MKSKIFRSNIGKADSLAEAAVYYSGGLDRQHGPRRAGAASNGGSIEDIMTEANAAFAEWRAGAAGRQVESHSERVQRGARIAASMLAERRGGQNDRDRMDIFGATAYDNQ